MQQVGSKANKIDVIITNVMDGEHSFLPNGSGYNSVGAYARERKT